MYHSIPPGTRLYRVTRLDEIWPEPLKGLGAFYTEGGRYNRVRQPTVYASDDPLVPITEVAFHQARVWQNAIAMFHVRPADYPLRSQHMFWSFTIDPPPAVIDLEHPSALSRFQHPPHALLNPCLNYEGLRDLSDKVFSYKAPAGSLDPRPEGLKAPSVRTPRRGGFQPYQFALFVVPPSVNRSLESRSSLVESWVLTLEFQEAGHSWPVGFSSKAISWTTPRFRLDSSSLAPAHPGPGRPGSKPYRTGRWYRIKVIHA